MTSRHDGLHRITQEEEEEASAAARTVLWVCNADTEEETLIIIYDSSSFMHQNVGHLCIRKGGRLHEEVREEGSEAEEIPGFVSVPQSERPGGAGPAATAQRYGEGMEGGLPVVVVCTAGSAAPKRCFKEKALNYLLNMLSFLVSSTPFIKSQFVQNFLSKCIKNSAQKVRTFCATFVCP